MNTHWLETLCTISDEGSTAAAARKLGVSAAAVAERIKLLENELQTKLIGRAGRTVSLTPSGHAILELSRSILTDVAFLKQKAHMDRPRGQLNVGSISSAISKLFPHALKQLYEEHNELELVLGPGTSSYLLEAVTAGHLDCALVVKPPYEISKALRWSFVRDEPFVMLAPRARKFTSVGQALSELPLIKPLGWTGQMVSQILREMQINIHEPYVLDATDAVSMLISSGAGVAILADHGFPIDDANIEKIVIDASRYKRTIGFISPYQSGKQLMFEVLLQSIRDAAAQVEAEERFRTPKTL